MINEARELLEKIYHNPRLGAQLALGNGCERIAYKLTEDLVVKIGKEAMFDEEILEACKDDAELFKYRRALWDYTIEDQTELELEIFNGLEEKEKGLFNPILEKDVFNNQIFTISPRITTGRDLGIYSLFSLEDKLESGFDFDTLRDVCDRYELDFQDVVDNSGNFGVNKQGEIVVIDFGLVQY